MNAIALGKSIYKINLKKLQFKLFTNEIVENESYFGKDEIPTASCWNFTFYSGLKLALGGPFLFSDISQLAGYMPLMKGRDM